MGFYQGCVHIQIPMWQNETNKMKFAWLLVLNQALGLIPGSHDIRILTGQGK